MYPVGLERYKKVAFAFQDVNDPSRDFPGTITRVSWMKKSISFRTDDGRDLVASVPYGRSWEQIFDLLYHRPFSEALQEGTKNGSKRDKLLFWDSSFGTEKFADDFRGKKMFLRLHPPESLRQGRDGVLYYAGSENFKIVSSAEVMKSFTEGFGEGILEMVRESEPYDSVLKEFRLKDMDALKIGDDLLDPRVSLLVGRNDGTLSIRVYASAQVRSCSNWFYGGKEIEDRIGKVYHFHKDSDPLTRVKELVELARQSHQYLAADAIQLMKTPLPMKADDLFEELWKEKWVPKSVQPTVREKLVGSSMWDLSQALTYVGSHLIHPAESASRFLFDVPQILKKVASFSRN